MVWSSPARAAQHMSAALTVGQDQEECTVRKFQDVQCGWTEQLGLRCPHLHFRGPRFCLQGLRHSVRCCNLISALQLA